MAEEAGPDSVPEHRSLLEPSLSRLPPGSYLKWYSRSAWTRCLASAPLWEPVSRVCPVPANVERRAGRWKRGPLVVKEQAFAIPCLWGARLLIYACEH